MQIAGKVVLVTGAAGGIGAALARGATRRGARVAVADRDAAGLATVAAEIGAFAVPGDLRDPGHIAALVDQVEVQLGPVDLCCCNAGIASGFGHTLNLAAPEDALWQAAWEVNVLSHVRLARRLIPSMTARGQGHFLMTLSAAGLLTQPGSAIYSTTKHAALGFAESLAIAHHAQGIGVTALCPQAVDTALLAAIPQGAAQRDGVLSAEEVAEAGLRGVEDGVFLVTPHAKVRDYLRRKAQDPDAWIAAMRRIS